MFRLEARTASATDWQSGQAIGVFPDDHEFGSKEAPYDSPFGFVTITLGAQDTFEEVRAALEDPHEDGDGGLLHRRFRWLREPDIPAAWWEDCKAYATRPSTSWTVAKNYIRNHLGVKDL